MSDTYGNYSLVKTDDVYYLKTIFYTLTMSLLELCNEKQNCTIYFNNRKYVLLSTNVLRMRGVENCAKLQGTVLCQQIKIKSIEC